MIPAWLDHKLLLAILPAVMAGVVFELFLGHQGHGDFARGVLVLAASIVVLELVRRVLWRAGVRRYSGSGM